MPVYTYECRICGKVFDTTQPSGARDLASCPDCRCIAEIRPSPANFSFGWRLADECHNVKGTRDYFVRNV